MIRSLLVSALTASLASAEPFFFNNDELKLNAELRDEALELFNAESKDGNITGFLGLNPSYYPVNRTDTANLVVGGLVTLFSLSAIMTNFFPSAESRMDSLLTSLVGRADEDSCNCEAYCTNKYYYDSLGGEGYATEKRKKR